MPEFTVQVTEAERDRLSEFLAALRTPCTTNLNPESPWSTGVFEQEFRSRLLAQHCFIGTPLFQQSFDAALAAACRADGHEVVMAPTGQRFWDVMVDGKKLSLKSSKARNMRDHLLHISKLTEAAWIQDCRSARKRCDATRELFSEYCSEVDGIVQLRYFGKARLYELVEIPVAMFEQVLSVGRTHFRADGPTINIPIGKDPCDFTLKLDRSDAKITIANINKALCLAHGTWRL